MVAVAERSPDIRVLQVGDQPKKIHWTWVPGEEFLKRNPTPTEAIELRAFGIEDVDFWGPLTHANDASFVHGGISLQRVRSVLPMREQSYLPLISVVLDVPVGMVERYLYGSPPWPSFIEDLIATGHYHNDLRLYRAMGTAPINVKEQFWGRACSKTGNDPHVILPLYAAERADNGLVTLLWTGRWWCPRYLWTAYHRKDEALIVNQGCGDVQDWMGDNVRVHPPHISHAP